MPKVVELRTLPDGHMNQIELKQRTKDFARSIIQFCRLLPEGREGRLIGNQLFRAGTSVGANYRAACRGRSKAEFIAKLGVALEEVDESLYWLELLVEDRVVDTEKAGCLMNEAGELMAIFIASINTAKSSQEAARKPSTLREERELYCTS